MKSSLTYLITILSLSHSSYAQLKPDSKVFISFVDTRNEINVDEDSAKEVLKYYLMERTLLTIVDSKDSAEYIIQLQLFEGNMGNRIGKLEVIDNTFNKVIFASKSVRGRVIITYSYSSIRNAIDKLVSKELLHNFSDIKKK